MFEPEPSPGRQLPRALRQYGGPDMYGTLMTGFGFSYYIILPDGLPMDFDRNSPRSFPVSVGRAGIPFRCLRWTLHIRDDFGIAPLWVRGIDVTKAIPSSPVLRIIPLMPEPVGMVLNVLIVSAAIVLPRMAWRGAVVFRRRRKGLCVKCGYPVSDFAVCPECGKLTGREA
ncbi:MAG: hypothetical protein IH985_10340 [Planctomycetes bacterium]|nr:hypothetical protein [Planctomycetota bacterium]